MTQFTCELQAGWGDMDFNAHMRNTAYLDKSGDVRMMYFQAHGFPMSEFTRNGIGPIITKDEIEYYREVRLLEKINVSLELAGMSADGSRFRLRNVFIRADGKLCAKVTSIGGWLDLTARRLTTPPEALLAALNQLDRSDDYEELPTGLR